MAKLGYETLLFEKLINQNYCYHFKIGRRRSACKGCEIKIQCQKLEKDLKKKLVELGHKDEIFWTEFIETEIEREKRMSKKIRLDSGKILDEMLACENKHLKFMEKKAEELSESLKRESEIRRVNWQKI